MKILFGIFLNAVILYVIAYFLLHNNGVSVGCLNGINTSCGLKTFIFGGIIIGTINLIVRPFFIFINFPLPILMFFFISILLNISLIISFNYIVEELLQVPGMQYSIFGIKNFAIAVAFFTILNMVYSLLIFKK